MIEIPADCVILEEPIRPLRKALANAVHTSDRLGLEIMIRGPLHQNNNVTVIMEVQLRCTTIVRSDQYLPDTQSANR